MSLLDNPFGMNPQRQSPTEIYRMLAFGFVMIAGFMVMDTMMFKPQRDAALARQQSLANPAAVTQVAAPQPRDLVLADSASASRIIMENNDVKASIDLRGARLDDLILKQYFETLDEKDNVALLSPSASDNPQMVQFGWLTNDDTIRVPDGNTVWTAKQDGPRQATLSWTSPQNVTFEQIIALDEQSLFSVSQNVINKSNREITVFPYGRVAREGLPKGLQNAAILHEGPIGYVGGKLYDEKFKQIDKDKLIEVEGEDGWIGITEKYWLAAILEPAGEGKNRFRFVASEGSFGRTLYQADSRAAAQIIQPGATATHASHAFVGPKRVHMLEVYEKNLNIPHFDLAVDFGMFYFLTRPFFAVLHFLSSTVGSFAIGLLLFSLCIRTLTFPLANNTYRSFAKLRKMAPQMQALKEKYGADRLMMQQELFKIYQKEKVNPAAGCFTILLQIPIFFALYKVLFVTIEMRHQPFFGWIDDMSAPDPTSLFNLFGLIPWTPPQFLMIGGWACIYCITMLLLQRLQPPPTDATQRTMMKVMPFMFTFMLAHFPAGLVIYWSWSNLLSLIQQSIIMKSMGVEVHFFHSKKHKPEDVELLDPKDDALVQMVESEIVEDAKPREISPPKRNKKKS